MPTFSVIPIEAFMDKRLTLEQLRVLGVLYSFKPRDASIVFPSRNAIAARCGMHIANISNATSALEKLGWISKEGKGGHSRATRYTLHIPETVAHSATVADQTTVAHSATGGVADSATRLPVAYSATRKELASEQTKGTKRAVAGKATRLSENWVAPAEWIEWAMKERTWSHSEANQTAIRFKNYWMSTDAKNPAKKDWLATWRNWVNRESLPRTSMASTVGKLDSMDYTKGLADV